jgi:hypothetical protein
MSFLLRSETEEVRIVRGHVTRYPMGLHAMLAPHACHHHVADSKPSGKLARRPMDRADGSVARALEAPCWTCVRAEGSSRTTSRCFAQVTAATRCAKVLYSWWMTALPFRMRTIAVYRVDPSVCLRARIVAMLCSRRSQAILDTYMAPLQPIYSP